jgi:hypothetical protein
MESCKRAIRVKTMTNDKIENFNTLTFLQLAVRRQEQMQNETKKKDQKDHIRDILMTMPDKNGYYTPPYS